MSEKTTIPTYVRIAIDIASRIYQGELKEGQKISGRSTLASEYNASSETVRKAIKILEDVGIVRSERGSGVVISSREKAYIYMNRFSNMKSLKDLEMDTKNLLKKRQELDETIYSNIEKIIEYTRTLRNTNPLLPFEVEVTKDCKHIGKTAGELKFWQHTGGTIAAIKRNGELILSPGPYATLEEKDVLLIIGNEEAQERVKQFLQD